MHSSHGFQSKIVAAALVLMLVTIWLLLRGHHELIGDGQLYAFQALARIHPQLAGDLYLLNTSQDQFTIFSPVYAWFIGLLGLEHAARLLTLVFTVWFLGAAWAAVGSLSSRDGAWLAVAFLLIVSGSYGGSGVFSFAEQFLTARLPAEALVVTSLACYVGGQKRLAIVIAASNLFVHPLIALPGLLLLICLCLPSRASVIGAVACVITALLFSAAATRLRWASDLFPVMDPAWLNVVQERSQFLFLQLWSFRDWEFNVRPFFYLAFTALAVQETHIRKLCIAAAIVAAAGLAVAFIASVLCPVAILLQGQAWRWVWIAAFVGALLLPATILHIWQDRTYGPLCSLFLISGLTLPALNGTACVSLAMILWLMKSKINVLAVKYLRWVSFALIAAIFAWILDQFWGSVVSSMRKSGGFDAAQVSDLFGLKICVMLAAGLFWWCIRSCRSVWVPALLSAALLAVSISILPAAFKQSRTLASSRDVAEFSDWERAIPPGSTVLVTPSRDEGTFVWFTLQRPNYLAIDQSAGVVFSRATALEVERRSQVLLPVMDPNWKILTNLRAGVAGKRKIDPPTRPLAADSLRKICTDTQLGFVISPEDIGFDRLAHKSVGSWMGWNLYDCRKVRSPAE